MRLSYVLAVAALLAGPASAQYQVTAPGVPVVETFSTFRGTGFAPAPSAGQLSSNNVSVLFDNDLEFTFGEAPTAPPFARGAASAPVEAGGVYGFEVAPGDYAFGIQPSAADGVGVGSLVYFRFQNATGQALRAAEVSVDYYVRNDQNRATAVDLFYYPSATGERVRLLSEIRFDGASKFATPAAGMAGAGWARSTVAARYDGFTWAPGEFLVIGMAVADAGGSGVAYDEIAFDNLSVTGIAETAAAGTATATLGSRPGAGNDAGWYLLSAPVQGQTVGTLAAQNLVQGLPSAYPDRPVNVLTGYRNNEPTPAASTADVLEPGRGFWWYLFDSATVAPESRELPVGLQATGIPRTGNVVVYNANVSETSTGLFPGGNPFDVPIALSGIEVIRPSRLFDAVSVWDPATQAFEVRSRAFGDTAAPWAGFVLESTVENVIRNASHYTYAAAARRPAGSPDPAVPANLRRLRFALDGQTASGRPVADRALALVFAEGAVDGLDFFDGRKLEPLVANGLAAPAAALVAFRAASGPAGGRRAQDARPFTPAATFAVPVALKTTEAGTFTLTWPLAQNVPAAWRLTLTDLVTGTVTDLGAAPGYTFTAQAADWTDRFTLTVNPNPSTSAEGDAGARFALSDAVPNPARQASRFTLRLDQAQHVRASLYDALGRRVAEVLDGPVAAGEPVQLEAALAGLAPGVYVLRVEGDTFQAARRLTVVR